MSNRMLDAERILASPANIVEHRWSARDTVLYNLGIGFGAAAVSDPCLLGHVTEEEAVAFPTMVTVIGMMRPSRFDPALGIDFAGMLHGEEAIEILHPLPAEGTLVSTNSFLGLWDKGRERGAVLATGRTLSDPETGAVIATTRSTLMLRTNGGYGGTSEGMPVAPAVPDTAPDDVLDLPTRPEQALLYRLSGDLNPLHSRPEAAQAAGFPRPILMGLCSFGLVGRALTVALAEGDPTRLRALSVRFAGVVYPGETLRIAWWRLADGAIAFRATVPERGDARALEGGRARFAPRGPEQNAKNET